MSADKKVLLVNSHFPFAVYCMNDHRSLAEAELTTSKHSLHIVYKVYKIYEFINRIFLWKVDLQVQFTAILLSFKKESSIITKQ